MSILFGYMILRCIALATGTMPEDEFFLLLTFSICVLYIHVAIRNNVPRVYYRESTLSTDPASV